MKYEIERRFLLKAIPDVVVEETILIEQFYLKNKDIWERVRFCESNKRGIFYLHTVKTFVSKSVNLEKEKTISEKEFLEFKNNCFTKTDSRFIKKQRNIISYEDLKWEVDIFENGYKLIIAEIEIPKKNYPLVIPDYINDVLLMEVTGIKNFSNKSLSLKISEKNKYLK